MEEALRLGKRIVPVLAGPLTTEPPAGFAERNYILFYSDPRIPRSGFHAGTRVLERALSVDIVWVRLTTRLLERASE